jgi:hypothetical protein
MQVLLALAPKRIRNLAISHQLCFTSPSYRLPLCLTWSTEGPSWLSSLPRTGKPGLLEWGEAQPWAQGSGYMVSTMERTQWGGHGAWAWTGMFEVTEGLCALDAQWGCSQKSLCYLHHSWEVQQELEKVKCEQSVSWNPAYSYCSPTPSDKPTRCFTKVKNEKRDLANW